MKPIIHPLTPLPHPDAAAFEGAAQMFVDDLRSISQILREHAIDEAVRTAFGELYGQEFSASAIDLCGFSGPTRSEVRAIREAWSRVP